jgi:hypothetical protein
MKTSMVFNAAQQACHPAEEFGNLWAANGKPEELFGNLGDPLWQPCHARLPLRWAVRTMALHQDSIVEKCFALHSIYASPQAGPSLIHHGLREGAKVPGRSNQAGVYVAGAG